MHALLLIHLPYTILHIIGFLWLGAFDDECTSIFGTKIEAFGECTTDSINASLHIWISVLAGTLMYMSFYFMKLIFNNDNKYTEISHQITIKAQNHNARAKYIFIFGLVTYVLSGILIALLDALEFNIFKLRGISYMIHTFLCHLIIAYALMQKLKIDLNTWIIYFFIILLSFTFVMPSKIHLLFFLLNLTYYFWDDYKGNLKKIFLPAFLLLFLTLGIYVFALATRDVGTVAFDNFSFIEYAYTIIIKAFVRITLFEPTILTSSLVSLSEYRASSNFFLEPRGYSDFVQLYFQNAHGYNLDKFGYAVGLPMIFYAEFGLEGVIMFSFLTSIFFHLIHIMIQSVMSSPTILFIPIYLLTMSDAGGMVVIFLVSLFLFIIFRRISA